MSTVDVTATALVINVKLLVVVPAASVKVVGTAATAVLLLDSLTTAPPEGAGSLSVMVAIDALLPVTLIGFNVRDFNEPRTVVIAVAELSLILGSVSRLETVAVLVIFPIAVGLTTILIVAVAEEARLSRAQVIVLVPLQVPWLEVAETKVTPDGSVSVTVTPVAADTHLLVTVSV
jgi:hypothetical protein